MAVNPRNGPCAPWVDGPTVENQPYVQAAIAKAVAAGVTQDQVDAIFAEAATVASETLYELSGRTFTGVCGPATVRPLARPTDVDTRAWGAQLSPMGWFSSWGMCSSYGSSTPGVVSHYGCSNPPEVELGAYPVTEILEVLIDGTVIPPDEYELRDYRTLVRMRPTASFDPTDRWGWPTCQVNDLPLTELGTFGVTFMYGQPPPTSGVVAARKLAEYFALPQLGSELKFPTRVTQVQRQGVSVMVADVIDIIKTGRTGIYEVDLFLRSFNPGQNDRPASVWSPDSGRPRRTPTNAG